MYINLRRQTTFLRISVFGEVNKLAGKYHYWVLTKILIHAPITPKLVIVHMFFVYNEIKNKQQHRDKTNR